MGFCNFTEAGSIGNDMIAASYIWLRYIFSFRARKNGRVEDLGAALLAAALATGVKASNLPLMLPILFVLWPALGLCVPALFWRGAGLVMFVGVVCPARGAQSGLHWPLGGRSP